VLGYTAGGSLIFYTFTTYMQKFLIKTSGMSKTTATNISLVSLFAYMCMQPLFGALSDRIGRRRSMMLFGGLGTLFTVPILTLIAGTQSAVVACILVIAALAIVSLYTSVSGIVKAEMFPVQYRALGVGVGYGIANALFGGSAEYVALQLKDWHVETAFYWYVTALMAIVFLVSTRLPKRPSYLHEDK
jgi:MHS family dicarboxylic acid transporter PcaT-like MFS transporter